MLFNSYEFIFLYLPIVLAVYYLLVRLNQKQGTIIWLAAASFFFYAWWKSEYLILLSISICFNYLIGMQILKSQNNQKPDLAKGFLIFGILVDLLLLSYYKYSSFLLDNINHLFHLKLKFQDIILPLGISFFTFTQIAYLVDVYRKKAKEYDFAKYILFVTYFPHLIAGPILHHKDMIPQFAISNLKNIRFQNIYAGIFIFVIGLFKKVIIADTLAIFANKGFDVGGFRLYLMEGWITSLAYTFQLYFDFSGYSDMAVGLGLLMQIQLPINFNCPYLACNIQDFWRRWHITLSNFLRDYVYIPLGGNKANQMKVYQNLILTFLIGGLWHGAGWLFIIWGALHGIAVAIHRKSQELNIKMPTVLAWLSTFLFVNLAWVFFRAHSMKDAIHVLKGMVGRYGLHSPTWDIFTPAMLLEQFKFPEMETLPFLQSDLYALSVCLLVLSAAIYLTIQNTHKIVYKLKPNWVSTLALSILTLLVLLKVNKATEFLYFNF